MGISSGLDNDPLHIAVQGFVSELFVEAAATDNDAIDLLRRRLRRGQSGKRKPFRVTVYAKLMTVNTENFSMMSIKGTDVLNIDPEVPSPRVKSKLNEVENSKSDIKISITRSK